MLGFILYLLVIGLVAGFIARFLIPGPDPMSILGTIVLGIVGSFIGGFLGWALFGKDFSEGRATSIRHHRIHRRCGARAADLQRGDTPGTSPAPRVST